MPAHGSAIEANKKTFSIGSGRQIRDFIKIEEAANDLLSLMMSKKAQGIYNIGSGNPISIYEMVEKCIKEKGSSISIKRGGIEDRYDEPIAFWADTEKIKHLKNTENWRIK